MFAQKNRLKNEKDIKAVFSKGKSTYDSVCGIKWRQNGLKDSRFAVVIGTKVHKRAVKRNRIRRQYREMLKEMLPELKMQGDILLLVSKKVLETTPAERKEKLQAVFQKAGLL